MVTALAGNGEDYGITAHLFQLFLIFLLFITPFTATFGIYQAPHGQIKQYRISFEDAQPPRTTPLDGPSRSSNDHNSRFEFAFQAIDSNQSVFSTLLDSVDVMQSNFFEIWQGTWPKAIDWTAAVMGTQVSATLAAMSRFEEGQSAMMAIEASHKTSHSTRELIENLINRYFTQITSFYFGENALGLRMQAFDDMLWVVLGWLEGIKFINQHSRLRQTYLEENDFGNNIRKTTWYGQQFAPQFAHRVRIFYDLASKGWNTSLCGGGMIWSPYLAPYKNAITNQLFIAASINMYLYFPGDENSSPFHVNYDPSRPGGPRFAEAPGSRYLDAAIDSYKWLKSSNMTNSKGLYVDGFHISGWRGGKHGSNGSGKCDLRDEMVYTYNQGVLLSGLRGLWEATGVRSYLDDGHELIRNVIAATGWHHRSAKNRWEWAGIGRNGVLEEACDSSGTCSQDSQTFKGIFFHHMASFCVASKDEVLEDSELFNLETEFLHQKRCDEYIPWVRHNANAAFTTRDENGEFGTWWGRSPQYHRDTAEQQAYDILKEGTDHMNSGVPKNDLWQLPDGDASHDASALPAKNDLRDTASASRAGDLNDRGRGRTVETQSGGVAVLRALWQMEGMKHEL